MNTPITHATNISVLIVGAGPTGLTFACDMVRRGVDFRIVEKATEYAAGSRGKGLQPRSMEVLDDLGVIDRILAHGLLHLFIRSYDGTNVLGDHDPHEGRHRTPDIPYESTLMIPQWRVEETLRMRLAKSGARVELATELVAFEQNDDCVTATLQEAQDLQGLNRVGERFKQHLQIYTIDRGPSGSAARSNQLIDDQGHVLHAYGGENGALFLIRPDGYIGFIGGGKSIDSVESYLVPLYDER